MNAAPPHTAIDRRQMGQDGEDRAAQFLEAAGLAILCRNYRCRRGELDIVAREHDVLVIAEVRLRSRCDYGGAAASVTPIKQHRIICATRHLIARNPALARLSVRFDVIAIDTATPGLRPPQWLRAAFSARR